MEKQIRGISWLKKIDMQKAGVRCRSTELAALSEQYLELKEEYTKAQRNIVKEILTVAGMYIGLRPMEWIYWISIKLWHSFT